MATQSEGNAVVQFEKARVNLWNIIGFGIAIAINAFGLGVTYVTMIDNDRDNAKAIENVVGEIKDIKAQLPAISQLQFQMTDTSKMSARNTAKIEENNKELNARIDRVAESFGDKLDLISINVNKIATAVEVLATRINERPQKTSLAHN